MPPLNSFQNHLIRSIEGMWKHIPEGTLQEKATKSMANKAKSMLFVAIRDYPDGVYKFIKLGIAQLNKAVEVYESENRPRS